jgi:hypothetical protein
VETAVLAELPGRLDEDKLAVFCKASIAAAVGAAPAEEALVLAAVDRVGTELGDWSGEKG